MEAIKDKHKGEEEHLKRVLAYHNKKRSTQIIIKGLQPELNNRLSWDWTCFDEKNHVNVAIEFKRITEQKLEELNISLRKVLSEISDDLKGNLNGYYLLVINVEGFRFPFNKNDNRKKFKEILERIIKNSTYNLNIGEIVNITRQIHSELPFKLPSTVFFDITKLDNEGCEIYIQPEIGPTRFICLNKIGLNDFARLVAHADLQLGIANIENTFLIFIDEGYKLIRPQDIEQAFKNIQPKHYSHIKYVYLVSGQTEPIEIFLPTPPRTSVRSSGVPLSRE